MAHNYGCNGIVTVDNTFTKQLLLEPNISRQERPSQHHQCASILLLFHAHTLHNADFFIKPSSLSCLLLSLFTTQFTSQSP